MLHTVDTYYKAACTQDMSVQGLTKLLSEQLERQQHALKHRALRLAKTHHKLISNSLLCGSSFSFQLLLAVSDGNDAKFVHLHITAVHSNDDRQY